MIQVVVLINRRVGQLLFGPGVLKSLLFRAMVSSLAWRALVRRMLLAFGRLIALVGWWWSPLLLGGVFLGLNWFLVILVHHVIVFEAVFGILVGVIFMPHHRGWGLNFLNRFAWLGLFRTDF